MGLASAADRSRSDSAFGPIAGAPSRGAAASPSDAAVRAAPAPPVDPGLTALAMIAGYYRIAADPAQLRHQLALVGRNAGAEDLVRGANLLQLKSRILTGLRAKRLDVIPYPAIVGLKAGGFALIAAAPVKGRVRLDRPASRSAPRP